MKTNWKKVGLTIVAAALLLTATAVVFSQDPPQRPEGPPGPRGPFGHGRHGPGGRGGFGPLEGLNLTDAQRDQIKQIHESFAESTKTLREQMRTLHENQAQGDPMSSNFDEAAFRSAAEARAKIQVEMEVAHAKMMSQVANVLTAEQRAQMAERHKQMRRMGPPKPPEPPGEPQL